MTQPAPNYGVDFWIGPNATGAMDADPSMRVISGRGLISQSLLCRLSTPRGSVIDCPNACMDLRDYVSAGMMPSQIAALIGLINAEVAKDQRMIQVGSVATFNPTTATLKVTVSGQSSFGPFSLVLAVTSVTVQILDANLP